MQNKITRYNNALSSLKGNGLTLYPHQQEGVKWMIERESQMSGGLLCDDPGLGKTHQVLSLVVTGPKTEATLIVVPTSIIEQWRLASSKLVGKRAVLVFHGPKRPYHVPRTRVVITTYDIMRDECDNFRRHHWDRIILDEIHKIKNSQSLTHKAALRLKATYKWGLTGTPVQNRTDEILSLFRFIKGRAAAKTDKLAELIQTNLIRRDKETVLVDKIPELTVETIQIEFMSELERVEYMRVQNNVREEYNELMELGGNARDENVAIFELLLRLRQASQHPQLVRNGFTRKFMKGGGKKMKPYIGTSSKHVALLKMLEDEGLPALVFCHFREEIEIVETMLVGKGMSCARIDGSTSSQTRAELIRNMMDIGKDIPQVLIIQIAAGGVGLNLQRYSRVYLLSPDWNPCNEIQAIGRSHRLGQTHPVKVRRLVLVDIKGEFSVIDSRILEIQQTKRDLMADLLKEPGLRENGKAKRFRLGKVEYKLLLGI